MKYSLALGKYGTAGNERIFLLIEGRVRPIVLHHKVNPSYILSELKHHVQEAEYKDTYGVRINIVSDINILVTSNDLNILADVWKTYSLIN